MAGQRLAEIGFESMPLILTLREQGTLRFLEFRLHNRDPKTGQLSSTQWAVVVDGRGFDELKSILAQSDEHIERWFATREIETVEEVRQDMGAQANATESAARKPHKIDIRNVSWRGPTFFASRSEGERIVIELNETHPTIAKICLEAQNPDGESSDHQVLGNVLAAYHAAKHRFVGPEHASTLRTLEALEYEWGMILSRQTNASA